MIQQGQEPKQDSSYFIVSQQFKAVFESQNVDQMTPKEIVHIILLQDNRILVYMNNGEYMRYCMVTQNVVGQGSIEANLNKLFYIDKHLVAYLSPTDKQIKVLDLNQNLILDVFGPSFPSQTVLPKTQRNDSTIESVLNDTHIVCLPGPLTQQNYYLLVYETKASINSEFEVVFSVLEFPKNVKDLSPEFNNIKFQYEYQNITEQRQMFGALIDEDTAAFYGQDFDPGQYEFTLCRPKLGENFVNIIYIPEPLPFVLLSITTWTKGKLGIWLNNNDSCGSICVDVLNYEPYFDAPNLNVQQIKNLYTATRVPLNFDNDVQNSNEALLSEVNFVSKDYALMQRIIGPKTYLQIVNMNKKRVLYSAAMDNIETFTSQDGTYYLQFNNLFLNPCLKTQEIYFQRFSVLDYKLYFLHLLQETKMFGGAKQFTSLLSDLFEVLFQ